ncbi:MAG: B12-binding domain-containing radical SAM protein [Candidatus Ratteibacteria bacterium]|nr:B12-binding domain-containing radical SAM protein [Candidatus Ratteibacteria bacterium]
MNILLINPWVCDFGLYDLWMKPFGLLRVAALLKMRGYNLSYIDFLDRHHPKIKKSIRNDDFGCGKFYKKQIPKPEPIKDVARPYFIYGLPEELITEKIKNTPSPDFILMTSGMTYWYPGLEYTAKFLKKKFPNVPIVLGGIYATLLSEHAKSLEGIDYVVSGADLPAVCRQLSSIFGQNISPHTKSFSVGVYPEYGLLSDTSSLVIETSKGCPFNCSYCGSQLFNKHFVQRGPKEVVEEIEFYLKNYGVKDIAFYDDALLVNADKHIIPILDGVLEIPYTKNSGAGINFHTPNGLHVRFIDKKLARKLKEANFRTITLSFETVDPARQKNTGGKVTTEEFKEAVENLKAAGFANKEISAYLMVGMPHQKEDEAREGIEFLHRLKIHITLVTYSLVPNTSDEKMLKQEGLIDDGLDPLWQNDTIFPLIEGNFSLSSIKKLRDYAGFLNRKI